MAKADPSPGLAKWIFFFSLEALREVLNKKKEQFWLNFPWRPDPPPTLVQIHLKIILLLKMSPIISSWVVLYSKFDVCILVMVRYSARWEAGKGSKLGKCLYWFIGIISKWPRRARHREQGPPSAWAEFGRSRVLVLPLAACTNVQLATILGIIAKLSPRAYL